MQALSVTSTSYNCSRTIQTVLERAGSGSFENPMAASQITPSLENRNYLELNKLHCEGIQKPLPESMLPPPHPTVPEGVITVHYRVENSITENTFNDIIDVTVPAGSSLLRVMEEAAKISPVKFKFTVEKSSWGPFVTSIQGLAGNAEDRTYWQFLTGKDALEQGVGDYKPFNEEHIVAKFSKY
ncbi:cobalamin binding intrinsic factor [Acipenser ruthenus]|uniref:cobalamin binding intrinsic factor n=1 Tax=Acipenser ruthenus TaxID=7906 RepID=UPI002740E79C|nr:cobalamin binding intrinsic factor [Acipenser ruthenus]